MVKLQDLDDPAHPELIHYEEPTNIMNFDPAIEWYDRHIWRDDLFIMDDWSDWIQLYLPNPGILPNRLWTHVALFKADIMGAIRANIDLYTHFMFPSDLVRIIEHYALPFYCPCYRCHEDLINYIHQSKVYQDRLEPGPHEEHYFIDLTV